MMTDRVDQVGNTGQHPRSTVNTRTRRVLAAAGVDSIARSARSCARAATLSLVVFGAIAFIPRLTHADVRLPKIFGDRMVLQRDQPISIWGWADADEEVTVTIADKSGKVKPGEDGRWRLKLPALEAGGPHELKVQGKNEIVLADVLVGEVWVCSGQSNMEWPLTASMHAQAEIAAADYPQIRLLDVPNVAAEQPLDDMDAEWKVCNPENAAGFSAVGYFFGRHLHKTLDVPVGLIGANWGGTVAEAWTSRGTLESDPDFAPILERGATFQAGKPNQPAALYNGMLAPIIPYTIRGAIWYQGESNVSRAQQYAELFPAMIEDWRKQWGQGDFPFLYVQLAPFRYGNLHRYACAELWEAQTKTLKLENTGMAVTNDISDIHDIHPRNKQDVGYRLALWALANTYGQKDLVYSGPLFKSQCIEDGAIRLNFRHVGSGLSTRDGQAPSHFEICGEDQQFVPATARIDGASIVVSSDQVPEPIAVRYAWGDDIEPNVINKEGLPASAFRTDFFKMVTDGAR